jgi:hypothetical protein
MNDSYTSTKSNISRKRLGKLQKNANGNDESKGFPYQQVVGSLMYAMLCTQPDLAYPISFLSQHMANLSMEHWMAIKRTPFCSRTS